MDGYTEISASDERRAMIVSEAEAMIDAQHGFTALADQKASALVGVASGLAGAGAIVFAWALTTIGVSALAAAGVTAAAGFSFAAHCAIRAGERHDRHDARQWPLAPTFAEHHEVSLTERFEALCERIEQNRGHLDACNAMAHRASVALGWTPVITALVGAAAWLALRT